MTDLSATRELHMLAKCYGVQTAYYDMDHHRQQASLESLITMLRLLGAPVTSLRDVPSALREYKEHRWHDPLEPVTVVWDGAPLPLTVRLPAAIADAQLTGTLVLETGDTQSLQLSGADLPVIESADLGGTRYVAKAVTISKNIPWGYHKFILELPGANVETMLLSAPTRAYNYQTGKNGRFWGVFLPLYSLYTEKSWGGGDLSDLERLIEWVTKMGGSVVGTLPLLPCFLDEPFEPSPYAPVSRLAWNEFYVDVKQAPELQRCPEAISLLGSSSFQAEIDALRAMPSVDYRRQMALKRRVLEKLSRSCLTDSSANIKPLRSFTEAHPEIEGYSRFRAAHEKRRSPWQSWPQFLREGVLKEGDYDEAVRQYYLYTQWLLHNQIESLFKRVQKSGAALYLDYPLGAHPDGYDVWRYQNVFIHKASVGAPPDPVFTTGQDWACPPLHPEMLRKRRYDYYISCLRHHLRHAGMLRIDHVMGLHRLFVIPQGVEPCQGVYLRYHPDEFYSILTLESHRARTLIIGEDLGTVAPDVRPAMNRHGFHRNYIVQYELCSDHQERLRAVPQNAMASINTHDMPPFTAFWQGSDIGGRRELNQLDGAGAKKEAKDRESIKGALIRFLAQRGWLASHPSPDGEMALRAVLNFLSASNAVVVLVNLEDTWLEKEPQNIPGTQGQRPNWSRKARYGFKTFSQLPEVINVLCEIDRIRKQGARDEAKKGS